MTLALKLLHMISTRPYFPARIKLLSAGWEDKTENVKHNFIFRNVENARTEHFPMSNDQLLNCQPEFALSNTHQKRYSQAFKIKHCTYMGVDVCFVFFLTWGATECQWSHEHTNLTAEVFNCLYCTLMYIYLYRRQNGIHYTLQV